VSINVVQAWLELIAGSDPALLLDKPWSSCPSEALYGPAGSQKLYANPRYREALDSWDVGHTTKRRDIMEWARLVRSGKYTGPAYTG
jgi:hypothetical protein